MLKNRLDQETSPYLLAHRDNPVFWQPWDQAALDVARQEGKPILLSIGYSACHWCHVMARESFEDSETAAVMNELFVNIKVDREERPDLDTIYQSALAEMGQQRGWPLTMFLTPEGVPYAGGTYFPPVPRYDRPAFCDALREMAEVYRQDPHGVAGESAHLVEALQAPARGGGEISATFMTHVAGQLLDGVDVVYGGFGSEPKFPHTMALELLWRAHLRTGHKSFRDAVVTTAEHMCLGGIYDHLGGGFARYAVDERWLVPHFEKMLYDNALLIELLTRLWRETREPLFAERVEETAAWLVREMTLPGGGFAASLAADSEGYGETEAGEGAFYVWQGHEIDKVLDRDSPFFKEHYDVAAEGNWEGTTILNRLERPNREDPAVEARLAELRAKLWRARETRPRPERDDKVLADWNGMMIAALADAGATFARRDWLDAALAAFAFVCERMSDSGRLHHSFRDGRRSDAAILDDQAQMARAALYLFETIGDSNLLRQAEAWVETADRLFWDDDGGGYFYTAADARAIITRTKTAQETSTPSGNAVMVEVLARLHALTAVDAYRDRAEATVAAFSADASTRFFSNASLINNSELLRGLVQVVVVGPPDVEATRDLHRAVREAPLLDRLLLNIPPDAALPESHPAAGKTLVAGRPAAYVCHGGTCQLPVTDAESLMNSLKAE